MTNEPDGYTNQLALSSFISMFLIIIFVISPLKKINMLSFIAKIIILILLAYSSYLCNIQLNVMRNSFNPKQSSTITSQLNANILGEYIFILFLGLLFIFVLKSML